MRFLFWLKIIFVFYITSCTPKASKTNILQSESHQVVNWSCADIDMDVNESALPDAQGILTTSLKPNLLCRWQAVEKDQCKFGVESLPLNCSGNIELCKRIPSYFKGCQIRFESVDLMVSASIRKFCQKNGKTVSCNKSCNDLSKNILVKVSYKSDCSRRY